MQKYHPITSLVVFLAADTGVEMGSSLAHHYTVWESNNTLEQLREQQSKNLYQEYLKVQKLVLRTVEIAYFMSLGFHDQLNTLMTVYNADKICHSFMDSLSERDFLLSPFEADEIKVRLGGLILEFSDKMLKIEEILTQQFDYIDDLNQSFYLK